MIADFRESAYQRQSSTPLEELWTVVDLTTGLRSGLLIPTDPDAPGIFSTISMILTVLLLPKLAVS